MLANQQIDNTRYPVFSERVGRLRGEKARKSNLSLAVLAASKVATCLGPTGAYKLVTYRRGPELVTKVTKDPVDIIEELGVQYPAIKTLSEAAKIHKDEAGDGVSTLLVLIGACLDEAQKMNESKIHPLVIVDGYKEAAKKAIEIIDEVSTNFEGDLQDALLRAVDGGRGLLNQNLRNDLVQAVQLVEDSNGTDIARIKIEKKLGGTVEDSKLVRGVVIKKERTHRSMPEVVEQPRIAIVYKKLGLRPPEQLAHGEGPLPTKLNIIDAAQIRQFKKKEEALRNQIVEKIKLVGANVVLVGHKIDPRVADKLGRAGIFALEMLDKRDLDETARATGAKIAGSVELLNKDDIGTAKRLEIDKIPPEQIAILYCDDAATVLLRGSSPELVQELEKIVKKAFLVIKHSKARPKIIAGGGAIFVELAIRLRSFALEFEGKKQLAIEGFAYALETIPRWLAYNCGLDPIDAIAELRAHHTGNKSFMGVSPEGCSDMLDAKVIELASICKTILWRTLEVSSLLLKIDDYFYVKERAFFHKQ